MKSLLSKEIKSGLIEAIGHELYAHNLYKSLANQMQSAGYFGAQKYLLSESQDELVHYQILADYINDRGDVALLPAVSAQKDVAVSLKDVFEIALEAESDLEKFYVELYEKAEDDAEDCVTSQFLLQFMEIQRKSIGEVRDILSMLNIAGSDPSALLLVDKKLGKK